ncbi:serine/threonine-protein kinase [Persicitalea jodogahamensis]|uniref:Protein kinase domain-containing protein n=1 Tax=Persicitalea jodogahamensis TaxID=402147 RepID=A0A8J3D4G4_9BACT|nr:serine/threonine-protein kinase [Persicitalea jodogahamensis]GHB73582.1 hypothetical protein GCM10007390_29650 [Persicitalea jodogahamensis]
MTPSFTTYSDFRQRYPIQFGDDALWLGSGTYGKVIKVEDQVETEWVAVKISECRHGDARSLKDEVELARKVPRHANIARYDNCYRLQTEMGTSDFAIMKYYADGNLADLLKSHSLSDIELRELVRGILEGLKLLHRHRIVHRDFKPANILISRDNRGRLVPKIADFGLSKFVAEDEVNSSDFDLSDGRGTPAYKAPEQITGGTVSFNLDLWAFGVILYEMVTGEKPFSAGSQASEPTQRREMENKIALVQLPDRLNTIAEPFQSMIRRCLVKDIHKRARRPDELLTLLENPTSPVFATKPAPVLSHFLESSEDSTDVFIPATTVSSPSQFRENTTAQKSAQVPGRNGMAVRAWPPLALGVVVLLIGSYVWSNRLTGINPETDQTQTKAAQGLPSQNYPEETGTPPSASVQQAAFMDKPGQTANDRAKPVTTPTKKGEDKLPKPADETVDKTILKKQQVQQEYDELIEKGNAAISSSNDKNAAMGFFRKANQLAATNSLDTGKGTASYTQYLEKGNRIFENNGFVGAMAWYKVAQSLRPTDEVSRKIKDCEINQ